MDIFGKLNELNLSLQGENKTIIDFVDTLSAFVSKLRFWNGKMALSKTSMFPVMNELLEDNDELKLDENIRMQISENLKSLSENFANYFPFRAKIWLSFAIHFLFRTLTLSTCSMTSMSYKSSLLSYKKIQLHLTFSRRRAYPHFGQRC